ncbi:MULTISPECIES: telomere-associated protein Tap [Streptomyces]|uniref:Helix-turn-helix n=1 Tax=Streptomyces chartreusis NRRL 3882 TaxID=1079985 RepID=A0A2N9BLH9_STRCX|nr:MULTISPECIES: helix-turn-helix transcriptional regulator [Streptomyces]MYS88603.1 helix-turn-helix domain-containing protein [Streptomyces sp. SID5464]SOR84223.1 Helix-turn-helix [Streptomyces chartreusis NRRL 3882]
MSELFDAVDALVASRSPLPPPAERKRLRQAHGLTLDEVAAALQVRRATVSGWEVGKTEPRPPERDAYARMLKQLAQLYPAANAAAPAQDTSAPETPAAPAAPAPSAAQPPRARTGSAGPTPEAPPGNAAPRPDAPAAVPRPAASTTRPSSTSRRPGTTKAAPANLPASDADPRFANGPLLVIDADDGAQVMGYGIGGLVLDVPAKSLPALVEWTLKEAQLGAGRLHGSGKDADPLLVLTESACERYGLPVALSDAERLTGRLPDGHKVIKQLERADWQLTKRGFGPWARIYRPARGRQRQCVQLCIPSWGALDARTWGHAAQLGPAELARVLGTYAARVMTPRGSTAVTGLELMTALNPPTRASEADETGKRHKEHRPGSLGEHPMDCAPCEAPDGHPLLAGLPRFHQRGPDEMLFEEAYDWARELTDAECMQRYLVGIDVNLAFGAAANGAVVGLATPPVHVTNPVFDPTLPGAWLVDLSHVDLSRVLVGKQWRRLDSALLPSPFTPTGERPEGPAWYATPTVAYAVELGYDVAPTEAWVREDKGRFLDGWYKRLRNAYVDTMADLGVGEKLRPPEFLEAMEGYRQRDPEMAMVLDAVKSTVKGGIGKLRERARGGGWKPGQPWPALSRPTWRPDIRAAVISRARINMHRKMLNLAAGTGRYPVAVLSDCAVYAAEGPSPLHVLPYDADGKTVPGSFRLGVSPGMVKHEGTQTTLWAEAVREKYGQVLNLARYIKTGEVTAKDDGE